MATYAIGDVQGCYETLRRLLDLLQFDPAGDRLWFAGDLVNRGPESLQTLRFVRSLGVAALSVLGNHDLHLLALAHGGRKGKRDTLEQVLNAPDREELLSWLQQQPLFHQSTDGSIALLHAGLPPQWDIDLASACAREAESALKGSDGAQLLLEMYGDLPDQWDPKLEGLPRLRFIINCFTRLRYCDAQGRLDFGPKGEPGSQPSGLRPWFMAPQRRSAATTLIFGHWSTLGQIHWPRHHVYGLDTGAVWGGKLTALRIDDRRLYAVESPRYSAVD